MLWLETWLCTRDTDSNQKVRSHQRPAVLGQLCAKLLDNREQQINCSWFTFTWTATALHKENKVK
jgi:hypothetical protein